MIKDKILALPPGRELDNWIAIEVLDIKTYAFTESGELWTQEMKLAPFYSTDISAAWEVVEKICGNDDVKFGIDRNYSIKSMWNAGFSYNNGSYAGHEATAAPEAIVKAALIAVMEVSHDL